VAATAGQQLERAPEVPICVGLGWAIASAVSAFWSALSHVAEPWTTCHSAEAKKKSSRGQRPPVSAALTPVTTSPAQEKRWTGHTGSTSTANCVCT
jgi:hypothetical protein